VDDAERVEEIILQTLGELAREGFDAELVEGALNTLEFRLREFNTGGFPRGLSMMLQALQGWMYDVDPIEALAFEKPLQALKDRLAAGEPVFAELIRKDLIENPHRVTVVLRPDQELAAREEAAEKQHLAQIQAGMTPADIEAVKETARKLHERQETPDTAEALATIPRLTLADLEKQVKTIPIEAQPREGITVLYHDLPTNGITYLDVGFDLHTLPGGLLPYVPLFGRALTEMGTTREDFLALSRRIGRETGGVRPETLVSTVLDTRAATAWLFLRGKAMVDKTDRLLEILRDTINLLKLDNRDRFKQMVLEHKARLESALVPGGNGFVRSRLGAHYDEAGWVRDQMGGFGQLFFIRQLARLVDENWPFVLQSLEQVRSALLNRGSAIANVTVERKGWEQIGTRLDLFLAELFPGNPPRAEWRKESYPPNEGLTLPASVNYVGKAANLFGLGCAIDGSDEVVTRYLTRTWLWDQVRVKGGAYGVGAGLDRRSGLFAFTSYRDPHLLETLQVYDESARFLRNLNLDRDELTKAIIGTISDLEPHLLPDAKGWVSLDRYLTHVTDADRQKIRDEVLGTTAADFRAFADVVDAVKEKGDVVVLGGPTAVEDANKERGGNWLKITNVGV
jgi:Zn-dependent M16 (insulinase) family peptidase